MGNMRCTPAAAESAWREAITGWEELAEDKRNWNYGPHKTYHYYVGSIAMEDEEGLQGSRIKTVRSWDRDSHIRPNKRSLE